MVASITNIIKLCPCISFDIIFVVSLWLTCSIAVVNSIEHFQHKLWMIFKQFGILRSAFHLCVVRHSRRAFIITVSLAGIVSVVVIVAGGKISLSLSNSSSTRASLRSSFPARGPYYFSYSATNM